MSNHVIISRDVITMVVVLTAFTLPAGGEAASAEMKVTVNSKRTDLSYNSALSDSSQYVFSLMETAMCQDITDAASTVGTVVSCAASSFSDGSPGVRGTMTLTMALVGRTESELFTVVSNAILTAAASNSNWEVNASDLTLVPSGSSPQIDAVDVKVTLISSRTDLTYGAPLADNTSFAFQLMNTTMCQKPIDAAAKLGTVLMCKATSFQDLSPGVKGSITLEVSLRATTEMEGFNTLAAAIVSAASTDAIWDVNAQDITLIPQPKNTESPRASSGSTIQIFSLLYLLFVFCNA